MPGPPPAHSPAQLEPEVSAQSTWEEPAMPLLEIQARNRTHQPEVGVEAPEGIRQPEVELQVMGREAPRQSEGEEEACDSTVKPNWPPTSLVTER